MPTGLFKRPPRQIQQPVGSGQFSQQVRSYDELVAAIGRIVANRPTSALDLSLQTGTGTEILIAGPIIVRSPIVLPSMASGTLIRSAGRTPLIVTSTLAHVFEIDCASVTLSGLFCAVDGRGPSVGSFVVPGSSSYAAAYLRVMDCAVQADRLFVDSAAYNFPVMLRHNEMQRYRTANNGFQVDLQRAQCVVDGNSLDPGNLGSDVIRVQAGGGSSGYCSIVGNFCNGGDIDTSAAGGGCVVAGNRLTGTLTTHAADAVGLNT